MGRFERTTELDENGVYALGHTVRDKETGEQEHFGVNGLTLEGRSVPDGDGHSTQMSPDGYTALGHTDTDDDDDSTHTDDEQVMAVGHTGHQPDRDVHMDVDRVSSRGSSVPGGSSGFQHFYDQDSDDESASDSGHRSGSGASGSRDSGQSSGDGYDSDDDYDSDYETPGSVSRQATSRTVPRGVETRWETWNDNYGYPIAVEVWYELQRDERGNQVYAPRLVDPDKVRRGSEENADRRGSEESAFEDSFEDAPQCRSQQNCDLSAGAIAAIVGLGLAVIAGTTLALVFGLRNRNGDSAKVPIESTNETTEKSLEGKLDNLNNDLNEILQQLRDETPEAQAAPQYAAPAQPAYAPPRAPEPRPTHRTQPSARAPRARHSDVRTRPIHPVTSDVESERQRVRSALEEWNPGLSNAELRARAGRLAPLFEDTPPSSPSLTERIHSIRVPPVPPYEGPKWKVRTEPKREQYAPQPMQNWARQRR